MSDYVQNCSYIPSIRKAAVYDKTKNRSEISLFDKNSDDGLVEFCPENDGEVVYVNAEVNDDDDQMVENKNDFFEETDSAYSSLELDENGGEVVYVIAEVSDDNKADQMVQNKNDVSEETDSAYSSLEQDEGIIPNFEILFGTDFSVNVKSTHSTAESKLSTVDLNQPRQEIYLTQTLKKHQQERVTRNVKHARNVRKTGPALTQRPKVTEVKRDLATAPPNENTSANETDGRTNEDCTTANVIDLHKDVVEEASKDFEVRHEANANDIGSTESKTEDKTVSPGVADLYNWASASVEQTESDLDKVFESLIEICVESTDINVYKTQSTLNQQQFEHDILETGISLETIAAEDEDDVVIVESSEITDIEIYDVLISPIQNKQNSFEFDEVASDLANFESNVEKAYGESLKTATLTPLIKEELKCMIQCRRLKRGESETFIQQEAPKFCTLSEEEIRKRNRRLEQNRRSARKARQKTRESKESLAQRVADLKRDRILLQRTAKVLKKERDVLVLKLKQHSKCQRSCLVSEHVDILRRTGLYTK